jgi:hypothetical protein
MATGKKTAKAASKLLRGKGSKTVKSVAASALSQRKKKKKK